VQILRLRIPNDASLFVFSLSYATEYWMYPKEALPRFAMEGAAIVLISKARKAWKAS